MVGTQPDNACNVVTAGGLQGLYHPWEKSAEGHVLHQPHGLLMPTPSDVYLYL
jgi:hypothetical protein